MRKAFILISLLVLTGVLTAQNQVYEYGYDAAGNRIRRAVVPLSKEGVGLPGDGEGTAFLIQQSGMHNGENGVFELIIRNETIVHQRFIPGGVITGSQNQVIP